MYHTVVYTGAVGQTVDTDIAALFDSIIPVQNNHFLLQRDMSIIKAAVMSTTLSRAKLNSPVLRQYNPTYVRPLIQAAVPPTNPNLAWWPPETLKVRAQEELQIQATSGLAMGTEQFTGILFLLIENEPLPIGDTYVVRFTSTTAVTANKWSPLTYTLETNLPMGLYTMIGSELQSTNGQVHRWIFDNQFWRPGQLSITSLANRADQPGYYFREGPMGKFRTFSLPRLECVCNGADAAFEGYFWVVRTGP